MSTRGVIRVTEGHGPIMTASVGEKGALDIQIGCALLIDTAVTHYEIPPEEMLSQIMLAYQVIAEQREEHGQGFSVERELM